MRKGKIQMACDCGNKVSFIFTVRGKLDDRQKPKPHTFWIVCADCDSTKRLANGMKR